MNAHNRLVVARCIQLAIEDWVWSEPPRTVVQLRERLMLVIDNCEEEICGPLPAPVLRHS